MDNNNAMRSDVQLDLEASPKLKNFGKRKKKSKTEL